MSRLGQWIRILTLHCDTASELASREMDETPGLADRLALRGHVLICRSCRRFRRQLLRIRAAARALDLDLGRAGSVEGATLSAEARRRIARALREEGPGAGPPP